MTLRVTMLRDDDQGAEALLGRLARAGRVELRVGVHGADARERRGEATLAQIAEFHEFGRGHNPERSFIRSTVDAQRRKLADLERRLARRLLDGTITERKGLGLIGAWLVSQMQGTIQRGIKPRLKDSTLERKGPGKTTPLIDTGRLVQSITWRVT